MESTFRKTKNSGKSGKNPEKSGKKFGFFKKCSKLSNSARNAKKNFCGCKVCVKQNVFITVIKTFCFTPTVFITVIKTFCFTPTVFITVIKTFLFTLRSIFTEFSRNFCGFFPKVSRRLRFGEI